MTPIGEHTELFILTPGLWDASAKEEVRATCDGLRELGLYRLPYPKVTVRVPAKDILTVMNPGGPSSIDLDERGRPTIPNLFVDITITEQEGSPIRVVSYNELSEFTLDLTFRKVRANRQYLDATPKGHVPIMANAVSDDEDLRHATCDFLIAMLATRNIVKHRETNKLAKLGIGTRKYKNRFTYTTTLSLPRSEDMADDAEHPPTGQAKAPHLRRGHIRNQHYGPQHAYTKRIWIDPVFVNADQDYVSSREAYNVTTGAIREARA